MTTTDAVVRNLWPRRVAAVAIPLGLATAAVLALVANIGAVSEAPQMPLAGLIGPARTAELRYAQFSAAGAVSPQLAAASRNVAARDPLAYEPFLFVGAAGFNPSAAGQPATGSATEVALLQEALRRNPRSRQARLLLMMHALGDGELGAALDQLAVLNRLSEANAVVLLTRVGSALATPAQVDDASAALTRHPELIPALVSGYAAAARPPELTARLAGGLPPKVLADRRVGGALIARLVADGDYRRARAVWRRAGGEPTDRAVSDPTFAAATSRPPFGWDFTESEVGVAERQGEGVVFVDYYGRRGGTLLRQLLTLEPGAYRAELEFAAEGGTGGAIALMVTCAGGAPRLVSAPLTPAAAKDGKLTARFTVPAAGCAGQQLALEGLPQERRTGQQVRVKRLDVVRDGGGR